ncbi:MAG: PucR family transcriptional regulator [Lachnospiraceae bacterium]
MDTSTSLMPVINALINNQGLDKIAECSAKALHNPFWIVDMMSNFIVPIYGDTTDSHLLEEKKLGYTSTDTLDYVRKQRIREQTNAAQGSFLFHPEPDVSIINCPVRITGITVAFISVKEETAPFTDEVYDQMEVIANIIATELQKDSFYKENKYMMYSYFLSDLIKNQLVLDDIMERLSYLGYVPQKYFYLLTLRLQNTENSSVILKSIQTQINFILPGSIYCLYENHAVFLYTSGKNLPRDHSIYQRLRRFLEQSNIYGAISDSYTNITYTPHHYQKTLDALHIGRSVTPAERLYQYSTLTVKHMLKIIDGLLSYEDFSDNAVGKLEIWDRENHASLLETLYQYLSHNLNISATANAMYLHQNTIRQRMEKIKEITGIPFENGHQVFEMMLALKIYRQKKRDSLLNHNLS